MKWARLIARPTLLWEAVRTAWAFRSRRSPFPSRQFLRWRISTAYGSPDAQVSTDDLIGYLEWRRSFRTQIRRVK